MTRTVMFASLVALCLAVGTTVSYAQRAHSPLSQPFRDIGLIRDQVPEVLQRAVEAPYAAPHSGQISTDANCHAIDTEIAALDTELGPDVDQHVEHHMNAGSLVAGAVRSALKLPYGSIIRHITGEAHREELMQAAVRSGTARRAFLKGLHTAQCTAPQPLLAPSTTLADATMPQPLPPEVLEASAEGTQTSPPPASLSPAPSSPAASGTVISAPLTQVAAIEPPLQARPTEATMQTVAVVETPAGAPAPQTSKAQ